jgi:hypothetical protein
MIGGNIDLDLLSLFTQKDSRSIGRMGRKGKLFKGKNGGARMEEPTSKGRRRSFIKAPLMTHKYRGCIVVLSINKSVEPNEEQKVLTSDFDQGFTVNTSKRVFRSIW